MKKMFGLAIGLLCASSALAQAAPAVSEQNAPSVFIQNMQMGTGVPTPSMAIGSEQASYWGDGLYYVPGYYPGYPTAQVLWPRVVEVPCVKNADGSLSCQGYSILTQQTGNRGDFILFKPVIKKPPVVAVAPAPVAPIVISPYCTDKKSQAIDPLSLLDKSIRQ